MREDVPLQVMQEEEEEIRQTSITSKNNFNSYLSHCIIDSFMQMDSKMKNYKLKTNFVTHEEPKAHFTKLV